MQRLNPEIVIPIILTLMALSFSVAQGQQEIDLIRASEGQQFSIEFRTEQILPALPALEAASVMPESRVFRKPSGGFLVAPLIPAFAWAEYDSEGSVLRVTGSEGEGPGEFRRIEAVVPVTDSLYIVFHGSRFTRITSRGEYLDSRFLRGMTLGAVPRGRGGLLVPIIRQERAGQQLTVLEFDEFGRIRDERSVQLRGGSGPGGVAGPFALDQQGALFLGSFNEYRLSVVDESGQWEKDLVSHPAWWADAEEVPYSDWSLPRTKMQACFAQDGLLWILFSVRKADSNWTAVRSLEDLYSQNDYFLEVVDLDSLTVLASKKYDQAPFHGVLSGGLSLFKEHPLTGEISIEIVLPYFRRDHHLFWERR